ncbi:replication factor A protein 1-like [Rutidosis leptorrhynchoides]|uniref:replication factor A protein 1-like n=1 Tax=Rutidosis leptorrhynchoides TaxID=125765 RepID=UPI003A9A4372
MKNKNDVWSCELLLLDESDVTIQATMAKQFVERFAPLLREGGCYSINKLSVIDYMGAYMTSKHVYKTRFKIVTSVKPIPNIFYRTPKIHFEFTPLKDIDDATKTDDNYLIGPAAATEMKLAFQPVLEYNLQEIFGNSDNLMFVSYLEKYVMFGRVNHSRSQHGWWYDACVGCNKKILQESLELERCVQCNQSIENPTKMFKLHLSITDPTGQATLILVEENAAKYVGKCPADLLKPEDKNDVAVFLPPQIEQSLVGKHFLFQVKKTKYNIDICDHSYSVICMTDDQMLMDHCLGKVVVKTVKSDAQLTPRAMVIDLEACSEEREHSGFSSLTPAKRTLIESKYVYDGLDSDFGGLESHFPLKK